MSPAPSLDPSCPGCGAPAAPRHHPFCSQGCRDRDLLQWLSDGYRIPVTEGEEDEAESDAPGLDRRAPPPL